MSTVTYTTSTKFKIVSCYKCGVLFGVPEELDLKNQRTHENFWCPSGHQQHYLDKSQEETLKEKLAAAERVIETTQSQRDQFQDQLIDVGRKLERTKKRLHGGKCPCCKHNFAVLALHMAAKHPTYGANRAK